MGADGLTVGIDLGTTNSVVAWIGPSGRPEAVPNSLGEDITPSVVCFTDEGVLVGRAAKELQEDGHTGVVAFFKRNMGDSDWVFYAQEVDHTPTDLSAILLAHLKAEAEASLGQPIARAVITVPAYFKQAQRAATIEAGRRAGLDVLQVINEPTAAAVAYGLGRPGERRRALVYDLGGGTFDVTILDFDGTQARVLTSAGDWELGGKDWDDRIMEFLATRFEAEFGTDPNEEAESLSELLVVAEDAKKTLSARNSTKLSLVHEGKRGRYELSRRRLEELTEDLMQRTVLLTERALADAKLSPTDIDGVLLVGGSTRMPVVHQWVERYFGSRPLGGVDPDRSVALGAALVAQEALQPAAPVGLKGAAGGKLRMYVDVTNHTLGMIAVDSKGKRYLNSHILAKDTAIPCAEGRDYQLRVGSRGGGRMEIFLTQGEDLSPDSVDYLGMYVVSEVPHTKGGTTRVSVQLAYDDSGTVQVAASAAGHPQPLRVTVEALPADVPARFMEPVLHPKPEPVTVYLCVDLSGSMSGAGLEGARKAAHGFVDHIPLGRARVGIMGVADRVQTFLPATSKEAPIRSAIDALAVGLGGCNSAHPFDEADRRLSAEKGKRIFVVLADGMWSRQGVAEQAAKALHATGVEVIGVGFGSADQGFLDRISSSNQGLMTDLSGLVDTFSTIAQELGGPGGGLVGPDSAVSRAGDVLGGFLGSIFKR